MKLETIKLWQRVQHIHKDAFKNCLPLQKFDGSYVSYFHDCAFANCTNLHEVNVDIDLIIQITADTFFGCIFPMLRLTFSDDMEVLLSQLPNRSLYWLCKGSTSSDVDGFNDENSAIFVKGGHAKKIDNYENTHLGLLQKTCSVSC